MEMIIPTEKDLDAAVEKLLAFAGSRKLLLFQGEIGAGKTTFIQAFCRHFSVRELVTSPTFSLVNEYSYEDPHSQHEHQIYHLDLYRLKNLDEALAIGIEEYLDSGEYCLVEWPEVIEPLWPADAVRIKIEILGDSSRKILFL